jgi:hypothetical protein
VALSLCILGHTARRGSLVCAHHELALSVLARRGVARDGNERGSGDGEREAEHSWPFDSICRDHRLNWPPFRPDRFEPNTEA